MDHRVSLITATVLHEPLMMDACYYRYAGNPCNCIIRCEPDYNVWNYGPVCVNGYSEAMSSMMHQGVVWTAGEVWDGNVQRNT